MKRPIYIGLFFVCMIFVCMTFVCVIDDAVECHMICLDEIFAQFCCASEPKELHCSNAEYACGQNKLL